MTELVFRNVDVSPDDPVEVWPLEAIQTALERGSLKHWRRLAAAIKAQPWGPVARDVEDVLTFSRPYGVAKVMERVIDKARHDAEAAERASVAAEVQRLIENSGLSRGDFASRIGTSASRLSTYATGKVTPSAALLVRMKSVAGAYATSAPERGDFASLAGAWRSRVKIGDNFEAPPAT
jgi:ribosome-binding protein aMBF1 (putative translation factor)